MIKLFESDGISGCVSISDFFNASVHAEINSDIQFSFSCPYTSELFEQLGTEKILDINGDKYTIFNISSSDGEIHIKALYSSIYEMKKLHIQNIPDMMGVSPNDILEYIFKDTDYTVLSSVPGCTTLDSLGLLTDYFSADKQTAFDAVLSIIENCGFGEIYIKDKNIALVERLGSSYDKILALGKHLSVLDRETDTSELITKLYPYGKNDLHIGSVNGGKQYVLSPNADIYGIKEGFINFSDVTTASRLKSMAEFQFSEDNTDRIDVPSESITAEYISCPDYIPSLGDSFFLVNENGVLEGRKRIISFTYYPFEPKPAEIVFGRIKKNLYYYLREFNSSCGRYDKISNKSGDIFTMNLNGYITTDENNIKSSNGYFTIDKDLLTIKNGSAVRLEMGNRDGIFGFSLFNNSGDEVISLDDNGDAEFSGTLVTNKDAVVGNNISIGNVSENPSISFYGMNNALMGEIDAFIDYDGIYAVDIKTAEKSGVDGRVYINGSEAMTVSSLIDALKENTSLINAVKAAVNMGN